MDFIGDISREIQGLLGHRRQDVHVRTGSLDEFVTAISKQVELIPTAKTGMSSVKFMGVDVKEDSLVPANSAVIMDGDEIINIVYFE